MTNIILLPHNIRSTHNIGALFRTAEGCGVQRIIVSGYSPYPTAPNDNRLPHIREKLSRAISKTALGAEQSLPFEYRDSPPLDELKAAGYTIVALEQSPDSVLLSHYNAPAKIALLIGEEVHGISKELLSQCDVVVEIPMRGMKESFNVSVATGMALYELALR